MDIVNTLIIDGASVTSSQTSDEVRLDHMLYYDIMAYITGTCGGSIKLQKCDDPDSVVRLTGGTWVDITSSSQNFTNNATLNWSASDIGFRIVRAIVTVTSGTAHVSMRLNAKGFV